MNLDIKRKSLPLKLAILCSLVLVALLIGVPVNMASTIQAIQVSAGTGSPGDKVPVTVSLSEKLGLGGLSYSIHYDKNQLMIDETDDDEDGFPDDISFTTAFNYNQLTVFNNEGYVSFAQARNVTYTKSGAAQLVTINFTVLPSAKNGAYGLTVSDSMGASLENGNFALGSPTDGSITVTGAVEAKPTVASITPFNEIKVPNGTPLSSAGLPSMVEVTLSDNSKVNVPVTWDNGNPVYNEKVPGSYTFTGSLNIPDTIDGTNAPKASLKLTVEKATITNVAKLSDINVNNGTLIDNLNLPANVELTLNNGDKIAAAINWDKVSANYDGTKAGTYTFTGMLTLPESVDPTNAPGVSVKVSVAEPKPDTSKVTYQLVSIDNAKVATLIFSDNVFSNVPEADLKKNITLAADGTNFNTSLGANDIVSITDKQLVITFTQELSGTTNRLKIAPNTLKDETGKPLAGEIITEPINATIDECFIATASFGSKFEPSVVLLRHFRDEYLDTNPLGREFVNFYYHNSPPIAKVVAGNEMLKLVTRVFLTPFIALVYLLYHPLWVVLIIAAIAFAIIKRKGLPINGFRG